jgi:hypothetical protein
MALFVTVTDIKLQMSGLAAFVLPDTMELVIVAARPPLSR